MTPNLERLKSLLAEALVLPATERAAFVQRSCGGDAALRDELARLLKAHESAGEFLEQPVVQPEADLRIETTGRFIGRYKLLQEIGEGGFGRVFMAEQTEPVHRRVALKIVKAGMDTREVIARFEAERQALALMEHPNIARILDAGVTDAPSCEPRSSGHESAPSLQEGSQSRLTSAATLHLGRPYFVMELVNGIPITDYCDRHNLPMPARLKLFTQVCHGVQHAHQKGIIHRDLKPTNILVTVIDGEPVPKIIDFGIAKALGQKLTEKTLFTAFQQMIGTPAYMSPEQAELSGVDVDTRSDIYSLGVLLYELLTGVTPFDAETFRKAALDEVRRIIREAEPPKPSTRLRTLGEKLTEVAQHRQTEPSVLARLVHGDLDWIVMKALEKDRARRYETAGSLVDDLRRHLEHEPVVAGPPGAAYRASKFIRRHRIGVVTTLALGVVSLLGLASLLFGLAKVSRERDRAVAAEIVAKAASERANQARLEAEKEHARAEEHAQKALLERNKAEKLAAEGALERGQAKLEEGNSQGLFDLVQAMKLASHDPEFQKVIAHRWSTWHGYWNQVTLAAMPATGTLSPDGLLCASIRPGQLPEQAVFVSRTFTPQRIGPLNHESRANGCAFTPDGKRLATVTFDGFIHLWDLDTGTPSRAPFPTGLKPLRNVIISPCGRYLLAWGPTTKAAFLRLDDPAASAQMLSQAMFRATFSPDGSLLAVHNTHGLNLLRVADLQPISPPLDIAFPSFLSFSPDGKWLAFDPMNAMAGLVDTTSGKLALTLLPEKTTRRKTSDQRVRFSHNGQWLATAGWHRQFELWDITKGGSRHCACQPGTTLGEPSFSPDDSQVAVPNYLEGLVWVYRTSDGSPLFRLNQMRYLGLGLHTWFNTNGLLISSADNLAFFWNTKASPLPFQDLPHDAWAHTAAFDGTGKTLATGSDGELRLWEMTPHPVLTRVVPLPGMSTALTFSQSENRFLAFTDDGSITRVNPATGETQTVTNLGRGYGFSAALSPDGSYAALWRYNTTFIIHTPTGLLRRCDKTPSACFSRDSKWLVTGSVNDVAIRQKLDANLALPVPSVDQRGYCGQVAIHPNNRLVTVRSDGRVLRLIDVERQAVLQTIQDGALVGNTVLSFSSDGYLLAAAGDLWIGDFAVELWNVDPARGLFRSGLVLPHPQRIKCLAFSPDNQWLAVGGEGITRVWRLALAPATPEEAEANTFDTLGFQFVGGEQIIITESNWELAPAKFDRVFRSRPREIPELEQASMLPVEERTTALEKLVARFPDVHAYPAILARHHRDLAENLAKQSAWMEALAHFNSAAKLAPPDPQLYYQRALLHLVLKDEAGYQQTCRELVAQFSSTRDPIIINWMVQTVLLQPSALEDYSRLMEQMQEAVQGPDPPPDFRRAALLSRAGHHEAALAELKRFENDPMKGGDYCFVDAEFFNPMTGVWLSVVIRARAGDRAGVETLLARFREHITRRAEAAADIRQFPKWYQPLREQLFQAEAEQLLKNPNVQ